MNTRVTVLSILLALAVVAGGAGGYKLYQDGMRAKTDLASATQRLSATQAALASSTALAQGLYASLSTAEQQNSAFSSQVDELSGTVGTLTKLTQTDPELLDKYSKVFFLSENYVPAKLSDIAPKYQYDSSKDLRFEGDAYPFLDDLLSDAHDDGIDLLVASAYRSFGTQATLKAQYEVTYGTGANAFSADQGYSEHQLGTAVDFTTKSLKGGLDGFDKTPAYAWLVKNGYKYGFELSYPAGNAYYQYEPWHWRFVGKDLARTLHNEKKNFYDLDQRTINEYLVSIFDN